MERRALFAHAIRFGLIMGGAKVAMLVATRLAGPEYLVSPIVGGVMSFVVLCIVVYAALDARKLSPDGEGLLFSRAMLHVWIVYALGNLLYTGASVLLFAVLEPSLQQAVVEPALEATRQSLRAVGKTPEQIEEQVSQMASLPSPFSPMNQVRGYLTSLALGTVGAAVVGLLLRRAVPPAPEGEPR